MKKYKVGLLTMSDGRPYLHELQYEMNMGYRSRSGSGWKRPGRSKLWKEQRQSIRTARQKKKRSA